MRLLQILALAAIALVSFKLIGLAARGAFEGLAVQEAAAQNTPEEKADAIPGNETNENENTLRASAQDDVKDAKGSKASLLQRLGERRDVLEKREQDLKLREELLQAAEKRLQSKLSKLKELEDAEKSGEKSQKQSIKDLVIIYENMKPKDAARIFDALSLDILHELATSMNPRKMSGILAEMDVKAAERLTVEIAAQAHNRTNKNKRQLSKIGQ